MPQKRQNTVFLIYDIIFFVLSAALCAAFIFEAVSIYASGDGASGQIYSPAVIKSRFAEILPVIILWSLSAVFGIVISCMAERHGKSNSGVPVYMIEEGLRRRVGEKHASLSILRKRALIISCIAAAAVAVAAVFPIVRFFAIADNIGDSVSDAVLSATLYSLPFVMGMIFVIALFGALHDRVIKKMTDKERELIKAGDISARDSAMKKKGQGKAVFVIRAVLLLAGAVLVIIGCFNGGVGEVFTKATKICTECIGLG